MHLHRLGWCMQAYCSCYVWNTWPGTFCWMQDRSVKYINNIWRNTGSTESINKFKIFLWRCTRSGEIAEKSTYSLDYEAIENESKYDGFYSVCTNLQDETCEIIKINKKRWEIEECFRIMKTEFKSRPVYLTDDDRIKAHFLTCYLALLIFRLLEKKLNNAFTCEQIIDAIREYNFLEISQKGYIPAYENSEIYSELHKQFGFYNDAEIVTYDQMNKIIKK